MISLNTLSAFTQEVARNRAAQGSTAAQGTQGVSPTRTSAIQQVQASAGRDIQPTQRTLEAVPAMPTKSLPRGSLLDLRV